MYTLIIPAHNEENSIQEVIKSAYDILEKSSEGQAFEIIVVNDGSSDATQSKVEELSFQNVYLINLAVRRGVGAARTLAVRKARGSKILFIDGDLTYDVHDIASIIKELKNYDMVIGARHKEKGSLPLLRSFTKNTFRVLASLLTKTKIKDLNSGLRGMDKEKTLEFLYLLPVGHSWVSTITLAFIANGYRVGYVDTIYKKREGKSKFNIIKDTSAFFVTILKTIVYFYPLRVILPVSFFFFMVGFVLFFFRDIPQKNIADTTILMWVVGFIMFIFALISEQLACLRREINQKITS